MEWRDIDLRGGTYSVRRAKRHLTGIYPINGAFRAVLESMEPGQGRVFSRWAHPDTVSKVIKKALGDAGLGHLTLHSLRHTFASQQLMSGRSMRVVGELLGQYGQPDDRNLRPPVQGLPGRGRGDQPRSGGLGDHEIRPQHTKRIQLWANYSK